MAALIEELVPKASQLAQHPFGNFVVKHILEYGTPEQVQRIINTLCADAGFFAKHKIANYVVQAALMHAQRRDRVKLVRALAPDHQLLMKLSRHKIASFVSREIKFQSKDLDA